MSDPKKDFGTLQYRVRPVERYVITRYDEQPGGTSGSSTRGEYDNADIAWEVAYALCKREHEIYGYAEDDERILYPRHPLELPDEPST